MIRSMPTTTRPQQRYDHRLRNLTQRTGDVTAATDLGVLRSTVRVARRGVDGRGQSGCGGPHGDGTPPGDPETAATRPEPRGVAPPRAGPGAGLRIHVVARATARRTRQEAAPARYRSGSCVHPLRALLQFLGLSSSQFNACTR
jgi:hypothetical protein